MSRRVGKIARLPKTLRDQVNTWLRDGRPYAEIIGELARAGVEDVNAQNLTNWSEGGYQDWLREQERLDDMRAKREFAMEIVRENEGSKIHEAGLQIAATQIYEILTDFDVASIKEKLQGDPENFARVVNAMAKLSEGGLKYERYRQEVAAAKARMEAEIAAAKRAGTGGITEDTLERIERELKLL